MTRNMRVGLAGTRSFGSLAVFPGVLGGIVDAGNVAPGHDEQVVDAVVNEDIAGGRIAFEFGRVGGVPLLEGVLGAVVGPEIIIVAATTAVGDASVHPDQLALAVVGIAAAAAVGGPVGREAQIARPAHLPLASAEVDHP